MKILTIKGFRVQIFYSYDGTQLFIIDSEGDQVYGHRVSGDPVERAHEVISRF